MQINLMNYIPYFFLWSLELPVSNGVQLNIQGLEKIFLFSNIFKQFIVVSNCCSYTKVHIIKWYDNYNLIYLDLINQYVNDIVNSTVRKYFL